MKRVAIVGATGAVGTEFIKILEERSFPVGELKLFASRRSEGKKLSFKGNNTTVHELKNDFGNSFKDIDIAFFSAGASISKEFAPLAVKAGVTVIDNSSAFRMDDDVPLVVPEINPEEIRKHKGIIANPNCSTIQMVVALKPLYDFSRIKRVIVTTFQSVSGTGQKAIDELVSQSGDVLTGKKPKPSVYPHQIAFNVIPQIDDFQENYFTKEEMKMAGETRKVMGDKNILVSATTVRVPVIRGHSESVYIETEEKVGRSKAIELLNKAPGVQVEDNPFENVYPLPINAANKDACFVGRIREDLFIENGLHIWVVADNLRKGAALNAVQIAEKLVGDSSDG